MIVYRVDYYTILTIFLLSSLQMSSKRKDKKKKEREEEKMEEERIEEPAVAAPRKTPVKTLRSGKTVKGASSRSEERGREKSKGKFQLPLSGLRSCKW